MTSSHLEPVFQFIPPTPRREDPAREHDDGSFRKHLAAVEPDHREASASSDEASPVGKDDPGERRDKSTTSDTDTEPQHLKTASSESADSPEEADQQDEDAASTGKHATNDDSLTDGENPAADAGTIGPAAVDATKGDIATLNPQSSSASDQHPTKATAEDASTAIADKSHAAKLKTVALPSTQTDSTGDSDAGTSGRNVDLETTDGRPTSAASGADDETSATFSRTPADTTAPADAIRQSPNEARTTIKHPQSDAPDVAASQAENAAGNERPTEIQRRGGRARSNSAAAGQTHASSIGRDPNPAINSGLHQEAPNAPESVTLRESVDAGADRAAPPVDDPAPPSHSTARPPVGAPFAGSPLGRPTHTGTAEGNPTGRQRIDPARFVARVAKALRMADERGGQLRLRLSPPELGSIRLELAVKNGALTATIETETTAARSALLDNLPLLRERLIQQNFRVEQFDVNVRDDGGNAHEQAAENRERRSIPIPRDQQTDSAGREDDAAPQSRPIHRTISRGDETLNVVA